MSKKLSPERLAEWRKVVDRWENAGLREILGHIEALEAELHRAKELAVFWSDTNKTNYEALCESEKKLSYILPKYNKQADGHNERMTRMLQRAECAEKELAESRAECERLRVELEDVADRARERDLND